MNAHFTILPLRLCPEWAGRAAAWFHGKWGVPLAAYRDSIQECLTNPCGGVPQWYLALACGQIVGGVGVIRNDFHLRPDLTPNLCALYVEPNFRGQGVARSLLDQACRDLARQGIADAYLLTDHTAFYEKCGWHFLCMVEEESGGAARCYHRAL